MRVSYLGSSESRAFIDANSIQIPLYMESVSAGFPFVRLQGESLSVAGIYNQDVLVVDRSLAARHGDFVIASVHGEMTVKS